MKTQSFFLTTCFLVATTTNPFVGFTQTQADDHTPPLHKGFIDLPDREEMKHHPGTGRRVEPWHRPIGEILRGKTDVPVEGLRGYWPFNGNANDESGNGNNGTIFEGSFTEDRFGNLNSAFDFGGGSESGILVENTTNFQLTAWTVASWINVRSIPNAGYIIVAKEWDANYNTNFGYSVLWTMEVLPAYETCSSEDDHHVFGAYISTNDWYFAVMTRNDVTGDFDVYINGELIVSGNWADVPCANATPLWFGPSAGEVFDGIIDDIRIYDHALNESEILELYNEGGAGSDPLAQFGVSYGSTGSAEPSHPGSLITIDPLTGAGTLIGPTGIIGDDGPAVRALAIKSTGEMYALSYTASSDLYSVNASTGASTFIANTGLLHPGDMVFDANDVLYAVDETNFLYSVDPVTGTRTIIGSAGVTLGGLAYDPTNGTIYGSDNNDGIYTIDVTTGAATLVGTTGLGGNTPDILFDQAGNLFGVKKGTGGISDFIAIDKTTGTGTIIGPTDFIAVVGLATRLQPSLGQIQWEAQNSGTTLDLYSAHFIDALNGWAVGGTTYGGPHIILHTRDGGETWVTQKYGSGFDLVDVFFPDPMNGWAVGEFGTILHTSNGGISWQTQVSNDEHNLFGVFFVDANQGWVSGDWSTMLHTTNGGTTWLQQTVASYRALSEIYFLDDGLTGWTSGNGGDIFHTTDGGNTWNRQTSGTMQSLSGLAFANESDGWVVGGNYGASGGGILLNTTNGGVSWTPQTAGSTTHLQDVEFVSDNVGWIVSELGVILHTTDAGVSWEQQTSGTTRTLRRVMFPDPSHGWAVGFGGTILHWDGGTGPISCSDITRFQARCRPGGTIQARIILSNTTHTGDLVEFTIDGTPYQVSVESNGRALLSIGVFAVGDHTVELTDPPGCYDPLTVRCSSGVAKSGDDFWEDDASWETPWSTELLGNYPNPFNPSTTIRYALSEPGQVTLSVYDMLGQLVKTMVDDYQGEGYHEAIWDGKNQWGSNVASGIYVYRMTAGRFTETKRMLLIK